MDMSFSSKIKAMKNLLEIFFSVYFMIVYVSMPALMRDPLTPPPPSSHLSPKHSYYVYCEGHIYPWITSNMRITNIHQGPISPTFYAQLFTHPDPKSAKNTVKLSSFFALLGSAHVKAVHKMLVKSTPERVCVSNIHQSK